MSTVTRAFTSFRHNYPFQSSCRVLRSFLSGRSGYSVRQFGFRSVHHRCGEGDEEDCHTVSTLCIWVSGRVGMTDGALAFDESRVLLSKKTI